MQKPHKLAIVFLITGALALPAAMPFANAQVTVPAQVTIAGGTGTCGMDIASGSPMNFGTVAFGQVSSEQTLGLSVSRTGGAQQIIGVRGDHWNVQDVFVMPVQTTHYTLMRGTSYDASTPLTETDAQFASFTQDGSSTVQSYWLLKPFLANPDIDPTGVTLHQSITFTSSC